MKRALPGLLAFLAVALSSSAASAYYVCSTTFIPGNFLSMGSHGYVQYSLYTGADCTGTFVRNYWICSSGATSTSCSSGTFHHATSDAEIVAIAGWIREAAAWNQPVGTNDSACIGGGANCAGTLFYQ